MAQGSLLVPCVQKMQGSLVFSLFHVKRSGFYVIHGDVSCQSAFLAQSRRSVAFFSRFGIFSIHGDVPCFSKRTRCVPQQCACARFVLSLSLSSVGASVLTSSGQFALFLLFSPLFFQKMRPNRHLLGVSLFFAAAPVSTFSGQFALAFFVIGAVF